MVTGVHSCHHHRRGSESGPALQKTEGIILYGHGHVISHCEISNSSTEFNDMGEIYMNLGPTPFHRGSVIHTNFFHHIGEGRPITQGGLRGL